MRIAIACFTHESNTFAATPTTLSDFQVLRGAEVVSFYQHSFHEVAGYIAGAKEFDFDLVPLLSVNATPSGTVTAEAYEAILDKILAALRNAPDVDGLLLALHGAMVSEEFLQADGETVRRLRKAMGPDFPIVVTHDYHGNVPPQLVKDATALVIYKTCPHIDQPECGLLAAKIMAQTVRGAVKPTSAIAKPELLFNIMFHNTSQGPMQPLMEAAIALETEPGILACSIGAGYQYADVPFMGPSIVVVTDNDPERAQMDADRLAELMWAARDQLLPDVPDSASAVRLADANSAFPVALFELGDNVGGGSAADATVILKELLAQGIDGWVVTLYDPEAVQACVAAGIGNKIALNVGGKTDGQHGPTLSVAGHVRSLHEGTYEEHERRHGGARFLDQGLTAVVAVHDQATDAQGLLVLNSLRIMPFSIHQITSVGIQPEQQRILVAKGAVAPRAAYEPVSKRIIEVDTSGATAINRPSTEYAHARKSLYEWVR